MRPFMAKEMFITSKRHIFMVKRYLLSEQISPDDFAEKSKNVSQVEAFLFCWACPLFNDSANDEFAIKTSKT